MPIDLSAEKNLAAQETAVPAKAPVKKPAGKKPFAFGGKC
jgi:hypothetical protein